ncbi:uncharacterized protein CcaverHIS019_0300310 [Cutaneotrichosporon cavernicola]|uniref:Mitochondrial import inner membrane translocase subunit Tim21 n=1 Tax=Cutaneotrichosporon cavernicola TaxID=279322 RepID=A0AA48L0J0_9TREE|nr:uncharacterized protein CcaverHIS019_0300310 [Cutaneotrichosporon cavernicola]BEI89961.1 hypothetical protein CcaverHIS019_0300310 [Cutaneotrichosporon cavernicola]BEI97734.1 hypothetical protein CcaverHIS631_0300330 [Cutaneotrichosporon cavernicola]BEJ05511.1 hypothetical protein CcaverHIS641_0300330 [Cutaneotrichosporon cavernicola]
MRSALRIAPLCAGLGQRVVFVPLSLPRVSSFPAQQVRVLSISARSFARPDHHPGRGESRESTAEMLDRLTAEARRRGAAESATRDYAGPFPLGAGTAARNKTWTAWRDLGIAGKAGRMFRQSGNLFIVVAGAGLFVVLAIALSTELFAKNSPSVLYAECIDMIRDSNALDRHLLPPVAFTHSPASSAPTRGTAPIKHRVVRHPVSGREHLIINFWAHGRGRDEPEPLSWAKRWVGSATDSLRTAGTFVGLVSDPDGEERPLTKEEVETAAAEAKAEREKAAAEAQQGPGFLGRLTQSFNFRPGVKSVRSASPAPPPPGTYKMGEVRADYVKNAAGHYTMLALVVDVPSSRAPYPGRAIVYWAPEADKEGLIERR